MIRSQNLAVIVGNVGKNPEVRQNPGFKTASFSVACSEDRKNKDGEIKTYTDWFTIVTHRKLAAMVSTGVKQGDKVCVLGAFRASTWDDKKTGEKRTSWTVEAKDVYVHVRKTSSYVPGDESNEMNTDVQHEVSEDDIPW